MRGAATPWDALRQGLQPQPGSWKMCSVRLDARRRRGAGFLQLVAGLACKSDFQVLHKPQCCYSTALCWLLCCGVGGSPLAAWDKTLRPGRACSELVMERLRGTARARGGQLCPLGCAFPAPPSLAGQQGGFLWPQR